VELRGIADVRGGGGGGEGEGDRVASTAASNQRVVGGAEGARHRWSGRGRHHGRMTSGHHCERTLGGGCPEDGRGVTIVRER
jgi:hypothetical protein